MRVVVFEDIGADRVQERGVERVGPLAAPDHDPLRRPEKRRQHRNRDVHRLVARAAERAADKVQQPAHPLAPHLRRNVVPLRTGDELRQRVRDMRLVAGHVRLLNAVVNRIAAVHRHRAAGHPAQLVGGEKQHRADQIVGLAEPSQRDHRLGRAPRRRVGVAGARQPGQRRARRDRVDADAVRRQIDRHRMRQRTRAALRGDIGGAFGPRHLGELRGHVDDAAARFSAARFRHWPA